ncbi:helix-turn-helix domain-containing protein [Photobacterium japonica]|uniref:helix-turn-helix domain-containing protein n=1 Tax=Photobacterium japonica TaxID=2910235 RepID=UPI003D0C7A2A
MSAYFYTQTGLVVIYGAIRENADHRHNAIQLVWPESHASLCVEGTESDQATVIASKTSHRVTMQKGWIILVEPHSSLGQQLQDFLVGQPFCSLEGLPPYQPLDVEMMQDTLPSMLAPLLTALNVNDDFQHAVCANYSSHLAQSTHSAFTDNRKPIDTRVKAAITFLYKQMGNAEGIAEKIAASRVAQKVGVSESRFLHLFRENMHITWRSYVLWQRLLCAINVIRQGSSATVAAHHAGFADSAHLSRTFKATFGLTLRDASEQWVN